jgi:vacuolar-type H+-ATPase subunit C/Vma6
VTRYWGDVVARVAGLRARLLGRRELGALAQARDLGSFAATLEATGRLPVPVGAPLDPDQVERAIRRAAAAPLVVLSRWAGERAPVLAPLFDDADRQSIRALLRGAAAGAPSGERLGGLLPTAALPQRALEELAAQPSVLAVVTLLRAWRHPLAEALKDEARRPKPDLLNLEVALHRGFADRARASIRSAPWASSSRRHMSLYLARSTDVENLWTAMQLAGAASGSGHDHFIEGGRYLKRSAFDQAINSGSRTEGAEKIAAALRGTPLEPIAGVRPDRAEREALVVELRLARRASWDDPLGLPRIIEFFLRLRAEARDLRTLLWHLALGAPAGPEVLVSPA